MGRQVLSAHRRYVRGGRCRQGKTFRKLAVAPRAFVEGNWASGTKNPAGRDWNTFDQVYPSSHDKLGFADQVGRRNLVQFRIGVEEALTKKWKIKQAVEGYWLATSNDNLYGSSGAIVVGARPGASRHIGNELDLIAEYQLNKGLTFGFGYARLFSGQFLKTTTQGHDYGYAYAFFQYNFSESGFHYPVSSDKSPGPYSNEPEHISTGPWNHFQEWRLIIRASIIPIDRGLAVFR